MVEPISSDMELILSLDSLPFDTRREGPSKEVHAIKVLPVLEHGAESPLFGAGGRGARFGAFSLSAHHRVLFLQFEGVLPVLDPVIGLFRTQSLSILVHGHVSCAFSGSFFLGI